MTTATKPTTVVRTSRAHLREMLNGLSDEAEGRRCLHIRLLEYTDQPGKSRVDRENGVIRGVKVIGRESKNNREYSDHALDRVCELAEGISCHVDHPDPANPGADRPLSTKFGVLRNVRRKPDGVYADLHYLQSHPMAEQITEAAERQPHSFGLSINADGNVINNHQGRRVVDEINKLRSVDLVSRPGATDGLFEGYSDPTDMEGQDYDGDPDEDDDDFEKKMRDIWGRDIEESEKVALTKDLIGATGAPVSNTPKGEVVGNTGSPARTPTGPDQLGVGDRSNPRSSGGATGGPDANSSLPDPRRFWQESLSEAMSAPAYRPSLPTARRMTRRPARKAPARLMESTPCQLPFPESQERLIRMMGGRIR